MTIFVGVKTYDHLCKKKKTCKIVNPSKTFDDRLHTTYCAPFVAASLKKLEWLLS